MVFPFSNGMKTIKNYFYRVSYKMQLLEGIVFTVFGNIIFLLTAHADNNGLNITTVDQVRTSVLCPIFNAMFGILMVISIIMILWGAFKYMKATGDAQDVTDATKTVTYAAVGIAVALCAKAFPIVVGSIFSLSGLTSC